MANKIFSKEDKEWHLFRDFWNLCQKYWIPEKNDEWWEELINSECNFCAKYGNSIFSRKLVMAFNEDLEVRSKSG